jgi:hypothetical protein
MKDYSLISKFTPMAGFFRKKGCWRIFTCWYEEWERKSIFGFAIFTNDRR